MLSEVIKRNIEGINIAIKIFGSVTKLAKEMGVSCYKIYYWRTRGLPPYNFAMLIYTVTDGAVKIEDVCRPEDIPITIAVRKLNIKNYRRRKDYGKCKRRFKPN